MEYGILDMDDDMDCVLTPPLPRTFQRQKLVVPTLEKPLALNIALSAEQYDRRHILSTANECLAGREQFHLSRVMQKPEYRRLIVSVLQSA